MSLPDLVDRPDLKFTAFEPFVPEEFQDKRILKFLKLRIYYFIILTIPSILLLIYLR